MRAAPPAEAVLAGGRVERALVLMLHLATGLVLIAWLHGRLGWPLAPVAAVVLVIMTGLGASLARWLLPLVPGSLRWDGQAWSLTMAAGGPQPVRQMTVQIDLGPWLLLRLQLAGEPGRQCWRVASQARAGMAWHGLCVALKAHAGRPRVELSAGEGGRGAPGA